jgi:hypothetical protein
MLVDLLNLVGLPALDPVLRRAQFNRKVNELANGHNSGGINTNSSNASSEEAKKASAAAAIHRRNVSAETRRFAAIRLAATSTSYQQELSR